jgi:CheY-like chemotaxis protein
MDLPRVLVVDDDDFVCEVVRRALRDHYAVDIEHAASGALRRLCDGARYAVLLCDLMMPGVSGLQLLAHVQRDFPEQATRFLFLTAAPTDEVLAARVNVLRKPFRRDELVRAVEAQATATARARAASLR